MYQKMIRAAGAIAVALALRPNGGGFFGEQKCCDVVRQDALLIAGGEIPNFAVCVPETN
jgi:hypothetical protein